MSEDDAGEPSEDDGGQESFEETVRSIVRELTRSIERVAHTDFDEVAEAVGVDLDRVKEFAQSAVGWLRAHAESLGEDAAFWGGAPRGAAPDHEPPASAGPHPLDLPTAEQGVALAAMDSGRWTVEPGSGALAADGEDAESARGPRAGRRASRSRLDHGRGRDHAGRSPRPQPLARRRRLIRRAQVSKHGRIPARALVRSRLRTTIAAGPGA